MLWKQGRTEGGGGAAVVKVPGPGLRGGPDSSKEVEEPKVLQNKLQLKTGKDRAKRRMDSNF